VAFRGGKLKINWETGNGAARYPKTIGEAQLKEQPG